MNFSKVVRMYRWGTEDFDICQQIDDVSKR